jgi:hypothetical protein
MNIIVNVKEIADLVKKTGDIELFKKIIGLESEIIELKKDNRRLTGQVAQLQTSLKNKDRMEFHEPFYFLKGDDVPFCPRCWERDELALHMVSDSELSLSGRGYTCTTCKTLLFER